MTSSQLAVNRTVVWAELNDEAVVLNIETGVYYGLDPVGKQIWRLVLGGADPKQIYDELLARYDVEPDQLRNDIAHFIDELASRKLLTISEVMAR